MCLGIVDLLISRLDVPLSPRSDNLHSRSPSFYGEFESYLIVALARAAVAYSVGAFLKSYLRKLFAYYRTCKSCTEQIAFVCSIHLERGNDDLFYHFIDQICDDQLACAGL